MMKMIRRCFYGVYALWGQAGMGGSLFPGPGQYVSCLRVAVWLGMGILATGGLSLTAEGQPRPLILASTTSTENSGFLSYLLPIFEAETGIKLHVVVVGTGRALQLGRVGDADVLLVHHPESEAAFMAEGYGAYYRPIMYNEYILVGPQEDPAGLRQAVDIEDAMRKIANSRTLFLSRGDESGTHKKELALWQQAGIPLDDRDAEMIEWRRETGAGMGATLNTANGLGAYTLSDRATWSVFRNREGMDLLYEGDPALRNPYGAILVDSTRHPHILADEGRLFIDWLTSPQGRQAILAFRPHGEALFSPLPVDLSSGVVKPVPSTP